jgi:large subunit ribosomal protein L10
MMLAQKNLTKAEEVQKIKELLCDHDAVGIASLQKVRAAQLQELRRKLKKSVNLRVIKNTIATRAISEVKDKEGLEKLQDHLGGSIIFLFTNLNPFKLAILLEKSRVITTAKAGDLAAFDVTVPAGNTGLPPGPIISQFNAAGLPTRIEAGSVWVSRDTLVAKKGDVIPARLVAVLSKLGIKSVEVGLTLKAVFSEGLILSEEHLYVDLNEFQRSLKAAYIHAFNLSLKIAYPLPENIVFLLKKAHDHAFNLALNACVVTRDSITTLFRRAHAEMLSLNLKLTAVNTKTSGEKVSMVQKG